MAEGNGSAPREEGSERSRTSSPTYRQSQARRGSTLRASCRRESFLSVSASKLHQRWWETIQTVPAIDAHMQVLSRREWFWNECLLLRHDFVAMWRSISRRIICCWLALWVGLTSAGCVILFLWNETVQDGRNSDARNIASSVARRIEAEVFHLSVPLATLSVLVSRSPGMLLLSKYAESFPADPLRPEHWRQVSNPPSEIQQEFWDFTQMAMETVSGDIRSAIILFEMSPRGIISIVSGDDKRAVGLDLLRFEPERDAAYTAIRENAMLAVGPVQLVENQGMGIIVHFPFYVPNDVEGSMDTRLMPEVNREVSEGENFWGFISVVVNATEMIENSQAAERLAFYGVRFSFATADNSSAGWEAGTFFSSHGAYVESSVAVDVNLPYQRWVLTVKWLEPSTPGWFWPSCAGIAAGALVVSTLVAMVLVSHDQNKTLLYRIMPKSAVELLTEGRQVVQSFDGATIFFSHLVGFTDLSSRRSPLEVVALLNDLYTEFDKLARRHQVFKVDTIGDAYMVVGGAADVGYICPAPEGAARVARFALEALELVASKKVTGIQLRAGMASGPVVAAVLGTAVPKYSFFGDTVNTASRMESTGEGGRLQVTLQTKRYLEMSGETLAVDARSRSILVKGKGSMQTFWVRQGQATRGGSRRRLNARDDSLRAAGAQDVILQVGSRQPSKIRGGGSSLAEVSGPEQGAGSQSGQGIGTGPDALGIGWEGTGLEEIVPA